MREQEIVYARTDGGVLHELDWSRPVQINILCSFAHMVFEHNGLTRNKIFYNIA